MKQIKNSQYIGFSKIITCCFLTLIFVISCSSVYARVHKKLQILLPGDFRGKIAEWESDLKILPSNTWRGPYIAAEVAKNREADTIVFSVGGESSIFSPLSYLDRGVTDRFLLSCFNAAATSADPHSLELFNNKSLLPEIKQRVWSNLTPLKSVSPFRAFYSTTHEDRKVRFFTMISESLTTNLDFSRWADAKIENPITTLKRLNSDISDDDLTLISAFLLADELDSLYSFLHTQKGTYVVLLTATDVFPFFKRDKNVCSVNLQPGYEKLGFIEVNWRNFGFPRVVFRSIPYDDLGSISAQDLFASQHQRIKDLLLIPLKAVLPQLQASTSAFSFKPEVLATFMKKIKNADFAFLKEPKMAFLNDNMIFAGNIPLLYNNSRLYILRIRGSMLPSILASIIHLRGEHCGAFAGIEFRFFAGSVYDLKINSSSLMHDKIYTMITTEETINDKLYSKIFKNFEKKLWHEVTSWDLWGIYLNRLDISDIMLYN